jgi:Peptidase family M1 domain
MRAALASPVLLLALTAPGGAGGDAKGVDLAADAARRTAALGASMATHAADIVDYTLVATLDTQHHTVHGEGTIHFRNESSASVSELWVHLYLNAFKNDQSVFLREPVGGFRGAAPVSDWGAIDVTKLALRQPDADAVDLWPHAEIHRADDEDETDARVPLPREIAPGESIDLDVAWDDKLPSILERTGYSESFHFVGQWFPKIARLEPSGRWAHFPLHHLSEFYADFGTYDVTVDVPASFTIGATGPVVDAKVEKGRRVERHVQADVHDFAWTAYDRFDERRETIDGVLVKVLFPKGYGDEARRELDTLRFAIPHYRQLYGPYPYPVLTVVHPPRGADEAGGMEYPTLITTGGAWFEPRIAHLVELVTMHEFGHQYFYGLVATDESTWPFLDEGLNSYAEQEALEAWLGPGSGGSFEGFTLSDAAVQAVFGNLAEHDEPVAQAASAFRTGRDYAFLVYERTGAIIETLRRVYGDGPVSSALRRYATRYRFQHPGPDELIECFEADVGERAADTLRTALFEEGWVDYTVTSISSKKAETPVGIFDRDGKRETLRAGPHLTSYEGWALVTRRGTLSFPVDVELALDDGTTQRVRWDGEDEAVRIPYQGPVALRAAVVDPDRTVTLDDNPANNHAAAKPTRHAPRVSERLAYWAELFMQAITP